MNSTDTLRSVANALLGAAAIAAFSSPAMADTLPSYATGSTDETIHGTIAAINGARAITVRDARGFSDNVTLHQGTIINPTGLTLAPGQTVTILGHTEGTAFSANQIDTPYQAYGAGYNYGYGYPYYGGFGYGYRPYPLYGIGFGYGRSRFGFGF